MNPRCNAGRVCSRYHSIDRGPQRTPARMRAWPAENLLHGAAGPQPKRRLKRRRQAKLPAPPRKNRRGARRNQDVVIQSSRAATKYGRTADAGRRNRAVRRVRESAGCQPARRFSTCPTRHSSLEIRRRWRRNHECTPRWTRIYSFRVFRYARKGAPRSWRFRANSTVAFRKPNLSPAS
jgi:hypothetical protein